MTNQSYQPRETAKMLSRDEAAMLLCAETGMTEEEVNLCGGKPVLESLIALEYLTFHKPLGLWVLALKGTLIAQELCPKCQAVLVQGNALAPKFGGMTEGEPDRRVRIIRCAKCPKCGYSEKT